MYVALALAFEEVQQLLLARIPDFDLHVCRRYSKFNVSLCTSIVVFTTSLTKVIPIYSS